jgi:hypothetical protein
MFYCVNSGFVLGSTISNFWLPYTKLAAATLDRPPAQFFPLIVEGDHPHVTQQAAETLLHRSKIERKWERTSQGKNKCRARNEFEL